MAKLIARSVKKENLESNNRLSSKDLQKGINIILVYMRLGMVKINDTKFMKNKIRMIQKICVKDNNVVVAA